MRTTHRRTTNDAAAADRKRVLIFFASLPPGRALFQKRRGAFTRFRGAARGAVGFQRQPAILFEGTRRQLAQQPLGAGECAGRGTGERGGQRGDAGVQLRGGNHAADESDLQRPPGREHFSEQKQFAEVALPQLAAEKGVYQGRDKSAFTSGRPMRASSAIQAKWQAGTSPTPPATA